MNTNTPRHTARPSRLRVTLARVGAWLDRHDDAVTLSAVAFIVATVSALLALALAIDHAMRTRDALAVAVIVIALSALSAFFAYTVGSDRATTRVSRRYSRYLNEQSDKHERALARVSVERDLESQSAQNVEDCLRADVARLTDERDQLAYDAKLSAEFERHAAKDRAYHYSRGVRSFVIKLSAPHYYDDRYYVDASVNGVNVGSGSAYYAKGTTSEQSRREAFSDALDTATLALVSASLAVTYPPEFDNAPHELVREMPTYEARA